jgi:hypothetical protein
MLYYRYTDSDSPMSDWGHAMFSKDQYKVENYGDNGFTIDDAITVDIYDLKEDIIAAWTEYQKEWADYNEFAQMDAEYIFESLAPNNIVDSADGWDHDLTVEWIWNNILEPKIIWAVRTPDGAICFDEELINKI